MWVCGGFPCAIVLMGGSNCFGTWGDVPDHAHFFGKGSWGCGESGLPFLLPDVLWLFWPGSLCSCTSFSDLSGGQGFGLFLVSDRDFYNNRNCSDWLAWTVFWHVNTCACVIGPPRGANQIHHFEGCVSCESFICYERTIFHFLSPLHYGLSDHSPDSRTASHSFAVRSSYSTYHCPYLWLYA